jgi:dTDP-4-amino-4,6-dideoxy-D-glucose acyltransferase
MQIGEDVRIAPQAILRYPDAVGIGDHCAIDEYTIVTTQLQMGSYIHIGSHASIFGGLRSCLIMEDFSGLSAGCRVICASDDFSGAALVNPMVPEKYRKVTYSTIRIGRFATVGSNSIILPGITIGEGAMVGAGSLVSKDLEPWGIYVGFPARRTGVRPREQVLALAEQFLRDREGER